jgi:hypothetical protein
MQIRQTGKTAVKIPDSMSRWAMIMNVSRSSLHREMTGTESHDESLQYTDCAVEKCHSEFLLIGCRGTFPGKW